MSIVIFVFSGEIFWNGWPGTNFCQRWNNYPDYKPLPETLECRQARDVVRITMGISAGFGIIIGQAFSRPFPNITIRRRKNYVLIFMIQTSALDHVITSTDRHHKNQVLGGKEIREF